MLKIQDAENLEKIPEVEEVYPMNFFTAKSEYKGEEQFLYVVTSPSKNFDSMLEFMSVKLAAGKTFNKREKVFLQ
jgi:hypothetical protein